jgi:amphi-Trp domain-containing protein
MSEETVHETEEKRTRRGIGSFLRRVADAFRRGEPIPVDDEQSVTVEPAAEPEMEIELVQEGETVELEIDMSWEADDEETVVDTDAVASKATFERFEDTAGEHRFRLRHRNGNIIADGSDGMETVEAATDRIERVRDVAPGAYVVDTARDEEPEEEGGSGAVFEIFEDNEQRWRWRLVDDDTVIADSGQGYASKQGCRKGMRSVTKNCRGAPVEDVEE